jgi:hypothetical protein
MFSIKRGLQKYILIMILAVLLLAGCGTNLYQTGNSGYTTVNDAIPGCQYEIPSGMLESATAITSIAKGNDYSAGTYLYKNGQDSYLVFNISSYIISVRSGTEFSYDGDLDQTFRDTSLNGIWFSPADKDEFKEQKKGNTQKHVCNVVADVSITEDLFGTFAGKLVTLDTENNQYSLFIGLAKQSYEEIDKDNLRIMNNIVNSLVTASAGNDTETDEYLLSSTQGGSEVMEMSEATETAITDTETVETDTTENTASAGVIITKIDTEALEDTEESSEDDVTVSATEATESSDASNEDTEDEIQITEENSEDPDTSQTKPEDTEGFSKITALPEDSSQEEKATEKETETETKNEEKESLADVLPDSVIRAAGRESDLYHQLEVGDEGQADVMGKSGVSTPVYIKVDKIYTGSDATTLLKKLQTKEPHLKNIEIPAGTSVHIARYGLNADPTTVYADIRLTGLDGSRLKYRGVSYSMRTYDALTQWHYENDMYGCLYCIYIVPNGCTEYTLQCGNAYDGQEKAFYKVKIKS